MHAYAEGCDLSLLKLEMDARDGDMNSEVIVDEEVDVLLRVLPSGALQPTSFLWRNKTRYVGDVGRTWEERVDGRTLRCYLVQAVDNNTFELRWDPAADVWTIHRAWLRDMVA